MIATRYKTPGRLLAAYYESRDEPIPAEQAYAWLRAFVMRRFNVDRESFDYTESILDRAVLDVEDVALNFLGLDLFLDDLSDYDRAAGAQVFGAAEPASGVIKVDLRAVEYQPLYRSTVMHEVAHVVLHHGRAARVLNYSPRSPRRPREEGEADRFMAESLLPEPILYLAIVLAERLFGVDASAAFAGANSARGRYQWRHYYFPQFLNRLCLSRELVAVRMVQRGTFSQSTFDYHLTYPIPNRWRQASPPTLERELHRAFTRMTSRPAEGRERCG